MTELLDFLLTRIGDDEILADPLATPAPGRYGRLAAGWWSPERVGAECAAKRRILQVALESADGGGDGAGVPTAGTSHAVIGSGVEWESVLRCLALPYADYPGFRAVWRLDP